MLKMSAFDLTFDLRKSMAIFPIISVYIEYPSILVKKTLLYLTYSYKSTNINSFMT